jgi:hypothetical protein
MDVSCVVKEPFASSEWAYDTELRMRKEKAARKTRRIFCMEKT